MLYADHGMNIYESSLMTTPKMIKEKPEVCQAVFDGAFEAHVFSMLHPDEAIDIFLQEVKETGTSAKAREFIRLGMGIFQYSSLVEEARVNGQGWADPKKIAEINDIVASYLAAPGSRKPAVDEVFTNQFAGRIKLTPQEWTDATKRHEEFARFLVSA
jgi:ABC-type nitrate/sulfonate/bicarbonate transport system substrate-binding protein